MSRWAFVAVMAFVAGSAPADVSAQRQIYKCVENGEVIYSERAVCAQPAPDRAARSAPEPKSRDEKSLEDDLPPEGVNMAAEIQKEFEREKAARESEKATRKPTPKPAAEDSWAQYERDECLREMRRAPVVVNSAWDGSVRQVEWFLKNHYLRDPDSYKSVGWTKVERHCGGYRVRGTYSARNGFGGMTRESATFELDREGNVVNVIR